MANDSELRRLIDHDQIRAAIILFATSLDQKDWQLCRSCFADQVYADYSDLRGEPPATIGADDFVDLRRHALSELSTHHLSTNHSIDVTGDEATCTSSMVIYRRLKQDGAGAGFDTHCLYAHRLRRTPDGWKITGVKQQVLWNTGDPLIHAGAKTKATTG